MHLFWLIRGLDGFCWLWKQNETRFCATIKMRPILMVSTLSNWLCKWTNIQNEIDSSNDAKQIEGLKQFSGYNKSGHNRAECKKQQQMWMAAKRLNERDRRNQMFFSMVQCCRQLLGMLRLCHGFWFGKKCFTQPCVHVYIHAMCMCLCVGVYTCVCSVFVCYKWLR